MSFLLTEPTTALVVGGSDERVERVRSVLTDGRVSGVVPTASIDEASETLAARDDVGCVLVLDTTTAPAVEAREAVREADDLLPVVVHVPESACDVAALARRGDCRFVAADADEALLRETVDEVIAEYDERRDEAARSSLFTTLLEEGDFPIFAKDERARHVYKAELDEDARPEQFIGKTDLEARHGSAPEQVREAYEDDRSVIEAGEPIHGKVEHYQYSDHEYWSRTTKVPWREDGEIRGLVGFSQDLTQQKLAERRVREQAERVDQFISYVTHDLRTPLQIAYGSLDRARDGDEEALESIADALERIEDIVADLSRLSKGDDASGVSAALQTLRAESLTTELAPLVENVWSVIAPDEADLIVKLPDDATVTAEAETVRPALENLLKNAVDHAGPDVTVWVGATGDRGFYVADDGPGIREEERPKVTEAGYTTSPDGTGTGLDIVAETVDQNGWDLTISESATGGARFEITGVPMVSDRGETPSRGDRIDLAESIDVGSVSVSGSADYDAAADTWTVSANGRNVWSDIHEFHYVHGSGSAPVRIEGRIDDFDGVEEYSKAGVAVRAGTKADAPFGYVGQTEAHGSEVTWRPSADGFTDSDQFEEVPGTFPWYRVDYVDGLVTCYVSEDGDEWRAVDQRTIALGESVSVGLMVCSHSSKETCEVTFSNVRAYELDG